MKRLPNGQRKVKRISGRQQEYAFRTAVLISSALACPEILLTFHLARTGYMNSDATSFVGTSFLKMREIEDVVLMSINSFVD